MLVCAGGLGQIQQPFHVLSLLVLVDSTVPQVSRAYQLLGGFHILPFSVKLPLFSLRFSGNYFSTHTHGHSQRLFPQAHAGKESKDWKILVPPVPPSLKTPLRSRARHSQLEKEFQLTQPEWVPRSWGQATADTKLWGQNWPPWASWGLSACLHLSDSKTEIAGQGKTLGGSASSLQCMGNLSHKMFIWCFVWWLQRALLRASERKFIKGT